MKVFSYSTILFILFFSGCIAKNAEKMEWYPNGEIKSQTRTGVLGIGYWFGSDDYFLISEPNSFQVGIVGDWNKTDPNSIKAIGSVGGNIMGTVAKEVFTP